MSKADMGERKSRLKTVRLPESLVQSLEKEAAEEGTTVNADINSILSRHFRWDKKTREFGIAEIPMSFLKSILEACDDDALARIGREIAPSLGKEMTEFWTGDSSPDKILDMVASRTNLNPNFQTRITREEGEYTITLRHSLGPKYSIIVKNAFQEFTKASFHVEPQISAGESVVTARFKVNPRNSPT